MNSRFMRMTSRLLIASVSSLVPPLQSTYAGMVETYKLPASGGVLEVLLTVFIILLITDIPGFTKVFPFTRSIR